MAPVQLRVLLLSGETLLEETLDAATPLSELRRRAAERLEHRRSVHRLTLLFRGEALRGSATPESLGLPAAPHWSELQLVVQSGVPFTVVPLVRPGVPAARHAEYDELGPMKILVLGNARIGKSSLITRFAHDDFREEPRACVGIDFTLVVLELSDGRRRRLQVWDSLECDKEYFNTIARAYFRGAYGVLVLFSVACRDSFEAVSYHLNVARQHAPTGASVHVLGAQADAAAGERTVMAEEAAAFCRQADVPYHEASSRSGVGVQEVFQDLFSDMLLREEEQARSQTDPEFFAATPGTRGWSCCLQ